MFSALLSYSNVLISVPRLLLIQDIFNLCFRAGFVIDGFYEECFKTNKEIPMVMIVRLKKVKRDSLK